MSPFEPHAKAIADICRRFHVERLDAFGSASRGEAGPESDIDLLVRFRKDYPEGPFLQYFHTKSALEALLGHEVDLVCRDAIRNAAFKQAAESEAHPLYAA